MSAESDQERRAKRLTRCAEPGCSESPTGEEQAA